MLTRFDQPPVVGDDHIWPNILGVHTSVLWMKYQSILPISHSSLVMISDGPLIHTLILIQYTVIYPFFIWPLIFPMIYHNNDHYDCLHNPVEIAEVIGHSSICHQGFNCSPEWDALYQPSMSYHPLKCNQPI